MKEKFLVTFKETKKYNPNTRTLLVEADDEYHAEILIQSQFGTFSNKGRAGLELFRKIVMPSKKSPIEIIKTEKVK